MLSHMRVGARFAWFLYKCVCGKGPIGPIGRGCEVFSDDAEVIGATGIQTKDGNRRFDIRRTDPGQTCQGRSGDAWVGVIRTRSGAIFEMIGSVARFRIDFGSNAGRFGVDSGNRLRSDHGSAGWSGEPLIFAKTRFSGTVFCHDTVVVGGEGLKTFDISLKFGGLRAVRRGEFVSGSFVAIGFGRSPLEVVTGGCAVTKERSVQSRGGARHVGGRFCIQADDGVGGKGASGTMRGAVGVDCSDAVVICGLGTEAVEFSADFCFLT